MLHFSPVNLDDPICTDNPLHVSHFFSLKSMWWAKRKERQALILSVAAAWHRAANKFDALVPALIEVEISKMSLTKRCKDASVILDKFFITKQLGYNFHSSGVKNLTTVSPRKLSPALTAAVERLIDDVKFKPGLIPLANSALIKSTVTVQPHVALAVRRRLKESFREDLLPEVNWLLRQEGPITFYYERAGNLQSRDKSVWPIKAIEAWPGWLRSALFGSVVDIENAYCQFLMEHLKEKFKDSPDSLQLCYPDLFRLDNDRSAYRIELCRDYIKCEPTPENIKLTKSLLMAVANGSNISARIMSSNVRSQAASIVRQMNWALTEAEIDVVGKKLAYIAKQFRSAKKTLTIKKYKGPATRALQKKIFGSYFAWEREARYKIWNATGKTGLHLHDGIDGVHIPDVANFIKNMYDNFNLRVSVDPSSIP